MDSNTYVLGCVHLILLIHVTVYYPTANAKEQRCEVLTIPMCKNFGYNATLMPNRFGHKTQKDAMAEMDKFSPFVEAGCSPMLQFFLCSLYAPGCNKDSGKICRSVCENATAGCLELIQDHGIKWPERSECSLQLWSTKSDDPSCVAGPQIRGMQGRLLRRSISPFRAPATHTSLTLINTSRSFFDIKDKILSWLTMKNSDISFMNIKNSVIALMLFKNTSASHFDVMDTNLNLFTIRESDVSHSTLIRSSVRFFVIKDSHDVSFFKLTNTTVVSFTIQDSVVRHSTLRNTFIQSFTLVNSTLDFLTMLNVTVGSFTLVHSTFGYLIMRNVTVGSFTLVHSTVNFFDMVNVTVGSFTLVHSTVSFFDMLNVTVGSFTLINCNVRFLTLVNATVGSFSQINTTMSRVYGTLPTSRPTTVNPQLTTVKPETCEVLTIPMCKNFGYNATLMPNRFGHKTQNDAMAEMDKFSPFVEAGCSPMLQFFLCSLYAPGCNKDSGNKPLPCRFVCEHATVGCLKLTQDHGIKWPDQSECSLWPTKSDDPSCLGEPDVLTTRKPESTTKNPKTTERNAETRNTTKNTENTTRNPNAETTKNSALTIAVSIFYIPCIYFVLQYSICDFFS